MSLDWGVVWEARWLLLKGAGVTILLAVVTMLVTLPVALLLAGLRIARMPIISRLIEAYVELMRSTPFILQLYAIYYLLPMYSGLALPPFATGVVALSANLAAYVSETIRAGILSIRVGQHRAGLSLGMNTVQLYRIVILPQAFRRITPALASTWVSLFKDTAFLSLVGVGDLAYVAIQLKSQTYRIVEFTTAMAVLYWMMGYPQAIIVERIYRRFGQQQEFVR